MIIKIKKRNLLIATAFLILAVLIPLIYAQTQTPKKAGFGVWLVIGNQNPVVYLINEYRFSLDPVSGSSVAILISFNVSDPDSVEQINGTNGGRVIVNLTLGSPSIAQFRTQTSCVNTTVSANRAIFNCTINMKYYDNNSNAWATLKYLK